MTCSRRSHGTRELGRADAEARTGRDLERRETMAAVAAMLDQAGGRSWMRAGDAALDTGATWQAPSDLTPEEVEVVRLLWRGYRNKEIAAALYTSVRTVELRLTRAYRKTGVATRAQLIALLDGVAGSV